jgi:RNA polymerase sigma factor (sigma-70 family)
MVGERLVVRPLASRAETASEFSTWVADYQRPLLGFAQLVAGHPETGEDLLQIALAKAFLKWSKIGANGQDPLAYVRRIIVNENASLWRHAWKRRERSTAILPEPAPNEDAPFDTTWVAVQTLPARQRTVIALRYYADLTVSETATMMGCSPFPAPARRGCEPPRPTAHRSPPPRLCRPPRWVRSRSSWIRSAA